MNLFQIKYYYLRILYITLVTVLSSSLFSCKKLVEVDAPVTSISNQSAYTTDATAIAVLTGIYAKLSQTSNYVTRGVPTMSVFLGLSADELTLFGGSSDVSLLAAYKNELTALNIGTADFWSKIYPYIFTTNSAIEGLNASTSLTASVKQQLLGEAKFMRAFFYFYLVNLYGDVPLIVNTDYTNSADMPRTAKEVVYQQIIADLEDANNLLSPNYYDGSIIKAVSNRVRPNKYAALSLLARTYLYVNDYANAEANASSIISNTAMYKLANLKDVFTTSSSEAIWQLQPVNTGWNTEDARLFVLSAAPAGLSATHPVYLSQILLKSFEKNDNRLTTWIDKYTDASGTYYFPNKYKVATQNSPVSEYLMVLRLGEQYLIRSEARAQQNNMSGALDDLNTIRKRAGLSDTAIADKAALLGAIQHERKAELFTEWGHRWLDMKRTNTINDTMAVITPVKGGKWETTDQLYPIPNSELLRDPNLVQNPGY